MAYSINKTSCINYFTKDTQYDIPVRQVDQYAYTTNPPPTSTADIVDPCNTWVCQPDATEYECMGIRITPTKTSSGVVTGYVTSYMNLSDWKAMWTGGACSRLFSGMVSGYGTTQSISAFSKSNYDLVRDDFNFMFSRYFNQDFTTSYQGITGVAGIVGGDPCGATGVINYSISTSTAPYQTKGKFSNADNNCNVFIAGPYGNTENFTGPFTVNVPGAKGYDNFLDTLLETCQNIPGACAQMQAFMCSGCSRDEIQANPAINKLCGCVAPSSSLSNFFNQAIGKYSPACDPLCNKIGTIKLANEIDGNEITCDASVCVIDNVQINSISSTGVVPTFNQVCPSCANGQGNCICIIDATLTTTIPSIKTNGGQSIDNNAIFTQYCPNSQCYISNPATGELEEVACSTTLPKGTGKEIKIPWWSIIIAVIILVVAIFAILAFKYQSENTPLYLVSQQYKNYY